MTSNKNHKKATETLKKVKEEKNKVEVKRKKKTLQNTIQNFTELKHTKLIEKSEIEKTTQVEATAKKNELSEVSVLDKSGNLENYKDVLNVKLQDASSKIEDTSPIASVKQETHQPDENQQSQQISNDNKKTPNINEKSTAKTQTNKNNKYQENKYQVPQENSFELVLSRLTSSDYENIFRRYAGNIVNNSEKIRIRNREIVKGSLSMNRFKQGGVWQRFSTGEEGNIFSFVQAALNCSKEESLKIVADAAYIELTNHRSNVNYTPKPKVEPQVQEEKKPISEWKAIEPIPDSAPKIVREVHLPNIEKYNIIDGIYTYKNNKDQLLGYTLRLIDKQSGEKKVMPFTYCYNGVEEKEGWKLHGFTDKGYKPIFGIEKTVNDDKPILIVEGEKSCRKAQKLLPEYTVISWMGGSVTASKVQWEQLADKEVIIFPDNDEPGMKAANTIGRILNAANGYKKNVTIVDPKALEFGGKVHNNMLPEKWDLADELPKGVNLEDIKEAIINKRIQNLVLQKPKNISVGSNKFSNIESDKVQNIADRILLQHKLVGVLPSTDEIKKNAIIEYQWQQRLSSEDALNYMKYAEKQGISGSLHEFLKYDHSFYQAILTSIAVNSELSNLKLSDQIREVQYKYAKCTYSSEFFKDFYAAENYLKYIRQSELSNLKLSDQIREVQYKYVKCADRSEFLKDFYAAETYLKYSKQLEQTYSISHDKTLLYKSLVGDFALLHREQLGLKFKDLPINYHDFMAKEIYQNISSYKANNGRGQSSDKLENMDKISITTKLCKTLDSNEMWKNLAIDLIPKDQNLSIQTEYLQDNNTAVVQKQPPLNNSEIIKIVKQGMDDLRTHGTGEDINNAFVEYNTHGIEGMNDFVHKTCQTSIEKKITDDLQIIENKYSGAFTKEKELITVKDFKGVSYTNDDDYLKGIKQDENTMRYISENSDLGKKIQNVVQRVMQCQTSNELER